MELSLHKFSKKLIILSLVIVVLTVGLSYVIPTNLISYSWPFILVFFLAVSILVYRYLIKKAKESHAKFINAFLLTTTVKLLLYLAIILIYSLLNRNDAIGFIMTFFTYYLFFTIFEIASIVKYLKKTENPA